MEISFFPTVCLRSPRYPVNHYNFSENPLHELINDELFMDSIYVASPHFYRVFEKWKRGEITDEKKSKKIYLTLLKYYNRMCFRATPFGLFSSYGTVKWGGTTNIVLNPNQVFCKIKLDTGFLCLLIESLEKTFIHQLSYQSNTSLYRVNDEYRYYEYEIDQTQKKYKLSAIEITEELDLTIKTCLNTLTPFNVLCDKLCDLLQLGQSAVADYLIELINSQVLVSALQPRLSDDDTLQQIITILKEIKNSNNTQEVDNKIKLLGDMASLLQSAENGSERRTQLLKMWQSIISAGIASTDSHNLFQLDSYNRSANYTINTDVQSIVAEGIYALQVLASENTLDKWYNNIKEKMDKRFGDKPVPLSHLFDPDTGIIDTEVITSVDFGNELLNQLNFFKSVPSNNRADKEKTSPVKEFFAKKLNNLLNTDSFIIKIEKEEIRKLEVLTKVPPLPRTFPVMFKLVNSGQTKLIIENAGGASGTALLGRFGNGDEETARLLRDIAKFEKDNNSENIIASVVHLPENRTGNVLQNPDLRDLQIPYLSSSALPPENQIPVSDIWIQLDRGSIILFSKKLDKPIIPRIDNAHNYASGSLSVYRLLGALQYENTIRHFGLNQSVALNGIQLSPRIEYKNAILQSAQWTLKNEYIISDTTDKSIASLMEVFNSKCIKWRIPELFLWAEADQTILVNRFDPLTFEIFITGIRKKKNIVIKEYIPPDPDGVVDKNNYPYNHQFVAIAKNTAVFKGRSLDLSAFRSELNVQRSFSPGTEWFYYKIYCSTYLADTLLSTLILPISKHWKEKGYIDHWFFIRYTDPDHHLRLRFHVLDIKYMELLINDLKQSLAQYVSQNLIWKIQIDTYERELERYSPQTYPFIEQCFNIDSEYCINALMHQEEYEKVQLPLFWVSLKNIDDIFNLCSFTTTQKHAVAFRSAQSFQDEFNIGDNETDIILTYYHQHNKQIKLLIENMASLPNMDTFINNHQINQQLQSQVFNKIKTALPNINTNEQIATSLIHMHYNRLYSTEQRRFEMIGYMLITRYYKMTLNR
ncbi:MAG: Lantibiotic dehydratase domain protein [Mucilaginibacter sp.]|nr:Lantibiotic dehydratase domain protein [Mucilaginibacter sp.]